MKLYCRSFLFYEFGLIFLFDNFLITTTIESKSKHLRSKPVSSKNYAICTTPECRQIADEIKKSMDSNVKPCMNFYKFACASWPKNEPIPLFEESWNVFKKRQFIIQMQIRELLEKPYNDDDIEPVTMAKQWYRSCMNEAEIEARGIEPISQILDIFSGWPITQKNWNPYKDGVNWQMVVDVYRRLGIQIFFSFELQHHDDGSILSIRVTDDYDNIDYTRFPNFEATICESSTLYQSIVIDIVEQFINAKNRENNVDRTAFSKLYDDVVSLMRFECELRSIQKLGTNRFHVTTFWELQKWYNELDLTSRTSQVLWLNMVNFLFTYDENLVTEFDPVRVMDRKQIKKLALLLDRTSERVIMNYVQWTMVKQLIPHTTRKNRDIIFRMWYYKTDLQQQPPRWLQCIRNLKMTNVLSYLYVKNHFDESTVQMMVKIFYNVREQIVSLIKEVAWLTPKTKKIMIEKALRTVALMGYPPMYRNDSSVRESYRGFYTDDRYLENVVNYKRFSAAQSIINFGKPVSRYNWKVSPISFNAVYSFIENTIAIPATIFQPIYVGQSIPLPIVYGMIGFLLGHEFSHQFDENAINYDFLHDRYFELGPQEVEEYKKHIGCFVEQYNEYTLGGFDHTGNILKVNGMQTRHENLADNLGIEIAYRTYQMVSDRMRIKSIRIPGLEEYDDNQLFFISFAHSWCSASQKKYEIISSRYQVHSPPKYRTLGVLANFDPFAKSFHCPLNTPLNPKTKCNFKI